MNSIIKNVEESILLHTKITNMPKTREGDIINKTKEYGLNTRLDSMIRLNNC